MGVFKNKIELSVVFHRINLAGLAPFVIHLTQIKIRIENDPVSVDRFLLFWSHHNQTIIQVLIVLTLIFIVALVFLTLFGAKDEHIEKSSSSGINITPDLEKSLQKMLENQTQAKSAVFDFSKGPSADATPTPTGGAPLASAEAVAQLEKMRAEMATREKAMNDLRAQLEQAQAEAQKGGAGGSSSGLEARIKELEARLAEYDIISEDIADLSRFKEENEKLKKQIAQMGTQAAAAPVAVAVAPEPAPAPVVMAAPGVAPPAPPAAELTPVPPVAAAEPTPEASAIIDDDLMKEFAAAVENQKTTTAATAPPPPPTAENEDLMGQFENFVQKKEGS